MLILLPKGVVNLAGKPFGKLIAKYIVEVKPGQGAIWLCLCECGEERNVSSRRLSAHEVTCCKTCRRKQRTEYLLAAQRRELEAGRRVPAGASDYEKHWRYHLAQMSEEQRRQVALFLEKRRRLNVEITDRLRASAVDVVMRKLAA